MESTPFIPDPTLEKDRLLVVEHALGEGGLIDLHLRWKQRGETPSSGLARTDDYGHIPNQFKASLKVDPETHRPSREPVDFTQLATDILTEPYDVNYGTLVSRINEVDGEDWERFLVETSLLDEQQMAAMKQAGNEGYKMDTLTEDNLPAYTAVIFGGFMALAKQYGIKLLALPEWSGGIWTAEEGGHLLAMNEYGKIRGILNSLEQAASRTSQLRAGIEVELHHVIQLFAYVAWQEFSALLAHRRNGTLFGPIGHALQERIGKDESRHHYVYVHVLKELYKHFPDDVIRTLQVVLNNPDMPGSKGVARYIYKSVKIHSWAIFGKEHAYQAGRTVLQKIGLLDEEKTPQGLTDEGYKALQELRAKYGPELPEIKERRGLFVLGKTITEKALADARADYSKLCGLAA